MSAATILDLLSRVRSTGPSRWIARCPAHEDRSPSLSVRELEDGRILLNDFGGCSTNDVLGALGLSMVDLFPKSLPGSGPAGGYAPSHSRVPARDVLAAVSREIDVAALILADVLRDRRISEANWQRLAQAAARVGEARVHVGA